MKDTTTTIDEILETIYFHGQTEDSINATGGSMSKDKALRIAKQALLQWHKDKARSYVLEVIGEDEVQEWDSDYTMCKHCEFQLMDDTQDCICIQRNKLRAEQRAKLDQTLKAIGGQE